MADLTLLEAVANPKLRPVLLAWSKRTLMDDQFEFLLDYNAKKPAKYLYETYIKVRAPKAKLDPALTTAGKPAAGVERDYKVSRLVETLKPAVADALRYFDSALKSVKKDGLPHDPIEVNRMFQSGRMRAEKVTTTYTQAILLDRAFNTKFAALTADKNKVDTQWAAYRSALSKK